MEKSLEYRGTRMAYTVEGEGHDVVLMHGWGCTAQTVASIARTCIAAGHRVFSVDFPGFGNSTEPGADGEVWGVERYTQIIERLVEVEGISNPVLIGHSFGGRVAIVYASRHADVAKVILVDAAGVKPRRSLKYYFKVYSFKLAKRITYLTHSRERAEAIIEARRSSKGSKDYAGSSPMMRRVLSKVVNEDLCHFMPQIKAPTLLIWGKNDTATPLRDARKMERLIANSGLVAFDGCGHYSFLDNPVQFAAVIQSFLKS